LCERRGVSQLSDLTDTDLVQAHPALDPEVRTILGADNAVKAFQSYGSTAPDEVERQLQDWKQRLTLGELSSETVV
jgi:argininosuccinate lyase